MMNAIVVPYFGIFPNYFQLFLDSCEYNNDMFTWLIFTDDKTGYRYPDNVKVTYCKFEDIQSRIRSLFQNAKIETPYKLCDYRPAYGMIFKPELVGYDFWGHCDVDMIFGKISNFLGTEAFKSDRIMRLGHLCLYKNTEENNRRFMMPIKNVFRYKEVFSQKQNCIFDEYNSLGTVSIEDIWDTYGFSSFKLDTSIANIHYKGMKFHLSYQEDKNKYSQEKAFHFVFYWDNGRLYRMYVEDNKLCKQDFMYMHLMKRPMQVLGNNSSSIVKIIPNEFVFVNQVPEDIKAFMKEKWWNINTQYFRVRYKNLKMKLGIR